MTPEEIRQLVAEEVEKALKPKESPWIPKNPYLRCGFFFLLELFSFFIIASNFRTLALGLYIPTAVTDAMIVCQSMLVTKLMVEDAKTRDWLAITGFSVGGACGSLLSIFVTKHLFGG